MDLNGIKIEVVPIVKVLDFASKQVLKNYYEQIKQISKDGKFLIDAAINSPKGSVLDKLSIEWITSVDGALKLIEFAIHYHNENINNKKVEEIFENLMKDQENMRIVVETIMGTAEVDDKKKSA
jgi:hypothetical protein